MTGAHGLEVGKWSECVSGGNRSPFLRIALKEYRNRQIVHTRTMSYIAYGEGEGRGQRAV